MVSSVAKRYVQQPEGLHVMLQEPLSESGLSHEMLRTELELALKHKRPLLTSLAQVRTFIEQQKILPPGMVASRFIKQCRKSKGLRTYNPKFIKTRVEDDTRKSGKKAYCLLLNRLFLAAEPFLIFDSCSFYLHQTRPQLWGTPAYKPTLPFCYINQSLHLHMLISNKGIAGYTISREATTVEAILYTLSAVLTTFSLTLPRTRSCPVLFLDNSPLHKTGAVAELVSRLGYALVFNIPDFPQHNPIEWSFALIKKAFRSRTLGNTRIRPQDVAESIKDVTPVVFEKTVRHVVNLKSPAC